MGFINFSRKDVSRIIYILLSLIVWVKVITPWIDYSGFNPIEGFAIYFIGISALLIYFSKATRITRHTISLLLLFWIVDIVSLPFCPLWSDSSIPLSESVSSDCLMKVLFVDRLSLPVEIAKDVTYIIVPTILFAVALLILSDREFEHRIKKMFGGK